MIAVKICGIKRIEDVDFLNKTLPEYAGFVFCRSKRQISIEQGRELINKLDKKIMKVGVFQNQSLEEVNYIIQYLNLNIVQLHGDEDESFIKEIKSTRVWKCISIDKEVESDSKDLDFYKNKIDKTYKSGVEKLLIDSSVKGARGGTGISFNWNILENIKLNMPFVLAGGLNSENVVEAIKMLNPQVVDVSSGVEENGVKSLKKIKEFIEKVRKYNER